MAPATPCVSLKMSSAYSVTPVEVTNVQVEPALVVWKMRPSEPATYASVALIILMEW